MGTTALRRMCRIARLELGSAFGGVKGAEAVLVLAACGGLMSAGVTSH